MSYFDKLLGKIKSQKSKIVSVACAEDEDVLTAVENARKIGIISAVLVGNKEKIVEILKELNYEVNNYEIIDEKNMELASQEAVRLVSEGKADIVMKGLVDTSIILKAVLNSKHGLRISDNLLSHVGVFFNDHYHKAFIVTDAAMNIEPTLEEKVKIINNAVKISRDLGVDTPKVACICAKEKVSLKMKATVDADKLQKMCEDGEIKDCIVGGPFALDNAISKEAAIHKGITHTVAGDADILLMPQIESGNVLYKALTYLSKCENASIIVGAKAPIVLTSRADSEETKFNSILLALAFNNIAD
ncbi:MAG: phosphate butyryltransferase [Fusobacteriaceae bacterium]